MSITKAKRIESLNKKVDLARAKYKKAMQAVVNALEKYSEIELESNDFDDDGFAISLFEADVHIPIEDVIEIIRNEGRLCEDDFDGAYL